MNNNNLTKEQLEIIEEYKNYEYEKYKLIRQNIEKIKIKRDKEYGTD